MNEYERYGEYSQQSSQGGTDTAVALKFLLIGIGIGAATALLFAPMSGREARNAIAHGCRTAFNGLSEQTRNLRDRGSNLLGFNRRKAAGGSGYGEGI